MLIAQFAQAHRLAMRRDACGDLIIVGKAVRRPEAESHICEALNDGRLGLNLMLDSARHWNSTKQRLIDAGMVLLRDGEYEGSFSFDPHDPVQAKLAIREARIHRRKVFSPETLKKMTARANQMNRNAWGQKP